MITYIILGTIALLSIAGMFYWMYKARNGTLDLSVNAWHIRLINWMWETTPEEIRNACPYYWTIVISILLLPLYLVVLYMIYRPVMWISDHWPKWLRITKPMPKIKLISIKSNFGKQLADRVPNTLQDFYKLIYRKGKTILTWIAGALWIGFVIFSAIFILVYPFFKFSFVTACICAGVVLYIAITAMVSLAKPEWDEYHVDHWKKLFCGVIGIILIPFRVTGGVISWVFRKIFNVVSDNCPPINWK